MQRYLAAIQNKTTMEQMTQQIDQRLNSQSLDFLNQLYIYTFLQTYLEFRF